MAIVYGQEDLPPIMGSEGPAETTNENTSSTTDSSSANEGTMTCDKDMVLYNGTCVPATSLGIACTQEQLLYGQCKFNIYQTLGIRQGNQNTSVGLFVQDIVLSSTFFIGTIVTIALVVSGLMYIFAGYKGDSGMQDKAKSGVMNSLIGLGIVLLSYSIIRLAQFLVRGG